MADGVVGVRQAATPDRFIDNEVVQNDAGQTVHRQKVAVASSVLPTGASTEATLELVRAQTAAINANTDAVETLLTTLRDNQLRRTDPLAAGTNLVGKVRLDVNTETMLLLASAARTADGTSTTFDVAPKSRLAVDVDVTATSGVGQELRIKVDRQGADGGWYPIWTSSVITAVGTTSTSIGPGMAVAQSIGATARVRWEITGSSPSFTFSVSVTGD